MRIGVDLGGSKIAAIALDAQGRVRAERRIASPSHDYARVLQAIGGLVDAIENELGVAELSSVGLGIPGSLSPATGLVRNANSTVLNGRPLQQDLDRLLGRAVRIENDANCFALSEATDGAGQGARVVFGVILGTGVGGGMVVEGRVLEQGARFNAVPHPLYWWRDAVQQALRGSLEQHYIRITANVPFETFWDDPGFAEVLRGLAGLGLAEAGTAAGTATADR